MSQKYEQFGKYLLLEKIAAGGMAEIYLARSGAANGLNKFFAIKRILPQFSSNEEFISMFKEEAKVAINLNHSNVVSIFDFGIEAGQFYLVMDYCEGRNLRQIINELKKSNKSFTIDQALFLVKETAAGLDHAHRCTDSASGRPLNITHRDMSPQNIMLSFEGEVKVIDFGIAKAETEAEATKAGTLKGKFSYMSPEQAEGETIDPRTDVFALGIVLWELLANDRLFTGSNEAAILRKVRDCQVPPIRKINPTVPPELERIVMKSLAKDRNIRYQTAANFHRDLNRFLNTQYPDFSPQDFSHFIKDSFKTAYQEGRDKLVAYTKADFIVPKSNVEPGKIDTVVPSTMAPVKPIGTAELPQVPSGFNAEQNQKIKLDGLRESANQSTRNLLLATSGMYKSSNNTIISPGGNPGQTRITQISQISNSKNRNSEDITSISMKAALVVMLTVGSWWGYKNYLVGSSKTKIRQVVAQPKGTSASINQMDAASVATIKISVSSSPDDAQILIDGRDTGNKTPAVVSLTANKETEITIRKNGYLDYKVSKTFAETSQVMATMQSISTAYLNISVNDTNSFTKISINGKELLEKPPIAKYPVVAEKEITISAYNPITKLTDVVKVTVQAGENMNVQLILGRNQNKNKK